MNDRQREALAMPMVGRDSDTMQRWTEPPWALALSFNR
jgi:hypothetical protein